ncbi:MULTISPECIES: DUF4352 domain-containing protein [Clostridia]|uniref:DUF4352 domain-containing protein n=1 Tax=Clostridia TaxID=186801 RepID=UPI000EA18696|nr:MULTISPECIES: DUF4352 domain-containing protein [Clostridia]NBJ71107.1 DUF4352 domain-containing protein [Roseburia sp. 1XD42-34]RKI75290.1 DUF4352 domain-containing protein [Clostridium sp. 1xD42-85]
MKKLFMFLMLILLSFALVACGGEESKDNDKEAKADEANSTEEKEEKEDTEKDGEKSVSEGDVIENEMGKTTILNKKKDMDELVESGPMKLTITGIQNATLEPGEEYKQMFDNKDKLTVITVGMKVENTSEDTISFYPDQATLTTNAGDQVEADMLMSDDVGGDFFGPTKKEGKIIFKLDTPAEEIKDIKLIINGASDENLETLGDKIELPLSF